MIEVNGRKLEIAERDMLNRMNWDDAMRACQNLGNGWRLPNKEELKAMYEQLHKQGKGNFKYEWYWSSSQFKAGFAWNVTFSYGGVSYSYENYSSGQVRAVRAF